MILELKISVPSDLLVVFGGILTKDTIKDGITVIKPTSASYCWIQLDKYFFEYYMLKDMHVCFLHISPEISSYSLKNGDHFEFLEQEIFKFSSLGNTMLYGDFHARTANNTDFIINDYQDVYNCYDDEYVFDLCDKRVSNDNVISNRGRQLLDVYKM